MVVIEEEEDLASDEGEPVSQVRADELGSKVFIFSEFCEV